MGKTLQEIKSFVKVYAQSAYKGNQKRKIYQNISTYCMFVGYPRSGHSLVGSLLDAHPDIIIAHELDALDYFRQGFSRQQVYHLILENSHQFATAGRKWSGYSYEVPNQWQGKFRNLQIIGDKKGGKTTRDIGLNPQLLHSIKEKINVPIKFIHVTRNPYDNISKIRHKNKELMRLVAQKQGRKADQDIDSLSAAIRAYFFLCETVQFMEKEVDKNNWLDIRQESLIADPIGVLRKLCAFLDVEPKEDYLQDCAQIIFTSPHKARHQSNWNQELIELVRNEMKRFEFLTGYSFAE